MHLTPLIKGLDPVKLQIRKWLFFPLLQTSALKHFWYSLVCLESFATKFNCWNLLL